MDMWSACLLLGLLVAQAGGLKFAPDAEDGDLYDLPEGFLIGAGTSAYQSEGAWNLSGKGINVYDHFYNYEAGHENRGNGNTAADSYHHIDDDIKMIQQLGLQVYRFSLSWTRLLPTGDVDNPNQEGIKHYNYLLDKLKEINVKAMVTIYHFDHPHVFHEKFDGWLGRGLAEAFAKYAEFAFQTFGDKVQYWITVNEPNTYCGLAHAGMMVPRQTLSPVGAFYRCQHNQLIAHALAYRIYQRDFAKTQGGKVGFVCFSDISRPHSTSYEDIQAASRANALSLGMCVAPAVFGDYPEMATKFLEEKDRTEERTTPRVPIFTDEEKAMLRDSADFIGLNVYYGYTVMDSKAAGLPPARFFGAKNDSELIPLLTEHEGGPNGPTILHNAFSVSHPWAMHLSLVYARDHFNNVSIFITENGYEDFANEGLHDEARAIYHSRYLREMLKTIRDFGVNAVGYTVWTLIDDFEWERAYKSKMGLVHIDYSSPQRTRTLKDSSALFQRIAKERRVPLVLPSSAAPVRAYCWTIIALVVFKNLS